jgi:hypothetical protein
MKSEEVALVASVGAITGAELRQVGVTSGNMVVDFAAGAAVAIGSWYFSRDGISDFGIGLGAGYALASVL